MGWLWPHIKNEGEALSAVTVAALIPAFCAVMLMWQSIQNGSWILAAIGGVLVGALALGVHLASRFAALGSLAILGIVIFLQPSLFGPWLCTFLCFTYGVRGSFAYWQLYAQRGHRNRGEEFKPFLSAIGSWLWPEIPDSRTALRVAQRAGLLVVWLGIELSWIEIRHTRLAGAAAELAVMAVLLFFISRGSRLAPFLLLVCLALAGRIFLPLYPPRPQHFLALTLLFASFRGSFSYHFWLWHEHAVSLGEFVESDSPTGQSGLG